MKKIYLVHHVHEMQSGEEDVKFIGAYETLADAELAVGRASLLPGFKDSHDDFSISECILGEDAWKEGFFTWTPEGGQDDKRQR